MSDCIYEKLVGAAKRMVVSKAICLLIIAVWASYTAYWIIDMLSTPHDKGQTTVVEAVIEPIDNALHNTARSTVKNGAWEYSQVVDDFDGHIYKYAECESEKCMFTSYNGREYSKKMDVMVRNSTDGIRAFIQVPGEHISSFSGNTVDILQDGDEECEKFHIRATDNDLRFAACSSTVIEVVETLEFIKTISNGRRMKIRIKFYSDGYKVFGGSYGGLDLDKLKL